MKEKFNFALKVLVALVAINFVLDLAGANITNYVYSPGKALGLVKT